MSCGPDFEYDCDDFESFLDEWDDDFGDMDDELDEEECDSGMFDEPCNGLNPGDPLSGV
jgi:hypothetical protein